MAPQQRDDRRVRVVLGTRIDGFSWETAVRRITQWARAGEPRYVCVCNVHSVVTARRDRAFRDVLNQADAATPDGMPIVWWLRRTGLTTQPRVDGPELMWRLCAQAQAHGLRVFLVGGTEHTLDKLAARLRDAFPSLILSGSYAPPFRAAVELDAEAVRRITGAQADLVFVGMGCPKQERWMALHRDHLRAVLIGVGAAFDFHAGIVRRAPRWMRDHGLEWAFRLAMDPRRLWRRYLTTNSWFLYYLLRDRLSGDTP